MEKLTLIHTRADLYRDQIIQLWRECLPGTPENRFEWLAHGNPAGPAEWFLAFDPKDGSLIGTSSVLPKELFYNGRKIRGGIVGDIMVSPAHRRKGVANQIQKLVVSKLSILEMEFSYVVPNSKSKKMFAQNVSYQIFKLKNYLIPIDIEHYLKIFKLGLLRYNIGYLLESYLDNIYSFPEEDEFNIVRMDDGFEQEINSCWETLRDSRNLLCGEKTSSYLKWKYCQNPDKRFYILKYRTKSCRLIGYCVFTIACKKISVYELVADKNNYLRILSALRVWAKAEHYVGIYFTTPRKNPILQKLPLKGSFRIGGDIQIICSGKIFENRKPWLFFTGERNI